MASDIAVTRSVGVRANNRDRSSLIGTICVLALSLYVIAGGVSDLRRTWKPIGVFGTLANANGVIVAVDPHSPAAKAGLVRGDRFDLTSLSPQQRWWVFPQNCIPPGRTLTVGIFGRDGYRRIQLTSVTERMGVAEKAAIWMETSTGLVMALIGTLVVLLKRNAGTWGFFVYCLATAPLLFSRELDGTLLLPYSEAWLISVMLIFAAGLPGLLIFALRILQDDLHGWRVYAQRAALGCFALIAALEVGGVVMNYDLGRQALWMGDVSHYISWGLRFAIAWALLDTYVRAKGVDRPRVRWMIAGIVLTLAFPFYAGVLQNGLPSTPALSDWPSIILAIAPIGVAYAIVKHRVIDIRIALSRTLVYGALTAVLVGAFGIIDWIVGRILDQTRLALVVDVCVAVALGFWLNGLHRTIERLVDQVLFRSRHNAERRLARLTSGLPHAVSFEEVDRAIVGETADALRLTRAALFRRSESRRFDVKAAVNWTEDVGSPLDATAMLLYLQGSQEALRLTEMGLPSAGQRMDPAFAVAVPIVVRRQVAAVLLLGSHTGGEDFDSAELRLLESCAMAAAVAYDHLEADALRAKVAEMQQTINALTQSSHSRPSLPTA